MPQEAEPFSTYHVEHIIARGHGGAGNTEILRSHVTTAISQKS
jgi:hypothetical protein